MVTWLLLAILLGLIPAAIAQGKGYDFVGWWFYGSALFIVALPHALMLQPNEKTLEHRQVKRGRRKCPFCAEMILGEAKVCRFCGRDVPPIEAPGVEASAGDPSPVPLDERHYTGRFNCPGCGAGRPYEGSVDIDDGTRHCATCAPTAGQQRPRRWRR